MIHLPAREERDGSNAYDSVEVKNRKCLVNLELASAASVHALFSSFLVV